MTSIERDNITGLVLAGGRGTRMAGADKGLQNYGGMPLALHALLRLQPQVGMCMISANRNLAAYESMGVPVWSDSVEGFAGPLAGILAGIERATTDWLVSVPCDSPNFPLDLVDQLVQAAQTHDAEIVMAATMEDGQLRRQSVFCLLRTELMVSLMSFLSSGGRKIDAWTAQHRTVEVVFEHPSDFANANTLKELHALQA